MKAQTETNN